MLRTRQLRTLTLPGGHPVAAASGLVRVGDWLHVVADDALELASFSLKDLHAPGTLTRLLPGTLPAGTTPEAVLARKAVKPDLEALCRLPPTPSAPHGALLALPSGSLPTRHTGVRVVLEADGRAGAATPVELGDLLAAIGRGLPGGVNLEGAALAGRTLWLLQRGNGVGGQDALVELDAERVLGALEEGRAPGKDALRTVRPWTLPSVGGVRLTFTDVSPLPDGRLVFLAVAEDTPDAVQDGPIRGSAVGLLAPDGTPVFLDAVDVPLKLEGVHAEARGPGAAHLWLVADADDPSLPAPLLEAELRWA